MRFAPRPDRSRPATAATAVRARGRDAFRAFVPRSDDRRLERTIGSSAGLRVMFAAMQREYVPEAAEGFSGDITYELRTADGEVRIWTVTIDEARAVARQGPGEPALTVRIAVVDFVRMAAGDLDAGRALLEGRLDIAGDFAIAMRLGAMFGRPAPSLF